jgi:hypothetical protein
MTESELAALEALANAATPGPWVYDAECGYVEIRFPEGGNSAVEFKAHWERSVHNPKQRPFLARVHNNLTEGEDGVGFDGAYIAAMHPQTALGLVAYIRELKAAIIGQTTVPCNCDGYP